MNLNYVPGNPATSPGTNAFQVSPLVPITTPWTLSPAPAPGTGVMTAVGSAGSAQQGFTPTLGTDTNIPTASSLAGAAGAPACNDANGGLTTLGCAAAAVTYAAVANQWLTAYSATTGQFTSAPVASTQLSDTANVARLNANNNFTVAQTAPAYIGTNGFRGYIYGENDITSSPSMSISQGTFITIYVKLQAGTNVAFAMPTSSSTGQVLNLCWEQNATTASTVVPPSNVHGFFSASGGAIGTTLGKTNCQSYISSLGATSTGWYATSGGSINE